MNEESKAKRVGWGWPLNSKKAHYFHNDTISLCGKWMYAGRLELGNDESADNCVSCMRKRLKL